LPDCWHGESGTNSAGVTKPKEKEQNTVNYWLMKSEPGSWSWDQQVAKGDDGEGWDGVRNHQASNNMKSMDIGDLAFFYHSVNEKQIVGIVEVCELYHPDPSDASGRFGMVTVKAVKSFCRPVTLAEIKAEPRLAEMALVRQSRLSVTPVSAAQWQMILAMGETEF
jgi:predicted RNA-binding protein with PUA-like domain